MTNYAPYETRLEEVTYIPEKSADTYQRKIETKFSRSNTTVGITKNDTILIDVEKEEGSVKTRTTLGGKVIKEEVETKTATENGWIQTTKTRWDDNPNGNTRTITKTTHTYEQSGKDGLKVKITDIDEVDDTSIFSISHYITGTRYKYIKTGPVRIGCITDGYSVPYNMVSREHRSTSVFDSYTTNDIKDFAKRYDPLGVTDLEIIETYTNYSGTRMMINKTVSSDPFNIYKTHNFTMHQMNTYVGIVPIYSVASAKVLINRIMTELFSGTPDNTDTINLQHDRRFDISYFQIDYAAINTMRASASYKRSKDAIAPEPSLVFEFKEQDTPIFKLSVDIDTQIHITCIYYNYQDGNEYTLTKKYQYDNEYTLTEKYQYDVDKAWVRSVHKLADYIRKI